MKHILRTAVVLTMLSAATTAVSAEKAHVADTVISVQVAGNTAVVDLTTGDTSDREACVRNKNRFVFTVNTEGGKAYLKLAIAAKLSGLNLEIWGQGTCNGSGEEVLQMSLQD